MTKIKEIGYPKKRIVRISLGINEVVISSSNEKDNINFLINEAKKIMKNTTQQTKTNTRNTDIR